MGKLSDAFAKWVNEMNKAANTPNQASQPNQALQDAMDEMIQGLQQPHLDPTDQLVYRILKAFDASQHGT